MVKRLIFPNLWISIALFLLAAGPASAQDMTGELDHLFKEVTGDSNLHFSGAVIVADHGKIIYQQSKGFANISEQLPNSTSTRFSLASLSKVFTATAIMQLVEKGKLKPDDFLSQYIPEFPFKNITIRQLLSHTSGLPDFQEIFRDYHSSAPDQRVTNQDIIPALIKYDQVLPTPGTTWNYSSPGMALLASLVEKISGKSFADYATEHIFKPAGMLHSYVLSPYAPVVDSLRAILYVSPRMPSASLSPADSLRTDLRSPFQTIIGPGLVVSSAADLLLFDQALSESKILSSASQEEMYKPVLLADGSRAQLEHAPIYAGLGWGIDIDDSAGRVASHNGGSPGISTIMLRNLKTMQTVIVLENTNNMAILAFGVNAMNILNHKPVRPFGPRRP